MSNAIVANFNNLIEDEVVPIFNVVIHKNEEGDGFWAICDMPTGGASTMGNTVRETQQNMYDSMTLFLKDDYPEVRDFSLNFILRK